MCSAASPPTPTSRNTSRIKRVRPAHGAKRGQVAAACPRRYEYAPFRAGPAGALIAQGLRTEVMARLVMKFGGTSVADIDRIRNVARHVKREVDAGHEVAVVVSAMSGTTNKLIEWCR